MSRDDPYLDSRTVQLGWSVERASKLGHWSPPQCRLLQKGRFGELPFFGGGEGWAFLGMLSNMTVNIK